MNDTDDPLVPVSTLQEGDLVDLEGDPFAPDDPTLEFEYATVAGIEQETPSCVRVDFESHDSVGFPPDHLVRRHEPA